MPTASRSTSSRATSVSSCRRAPRPDRAASRSSRTDPGNRINRRERIMNAESNELKTPLKEVRTETGKADHTRGVVFEPRVDIAEVDDNMLMYVDLPGVKSEDVDVRFENRELQIRGKVTPAATKPHFLLQEYG